VDGEWMRQEHKSEMVFAANVEATDSDEEKSMESAKQKKKPNKKLSSKGASGKWFAAMNILAVCALGIVEPQAMALAMAPLFSSVDYCVNDCDMYNQSSPGSSKTEDEPSIYAAQSTTAKHAITSGTKYLALNDGGCQLGGI
jgi:hypothetical protein